jgi:hypothetical protein
VKDWVLRIETPVEVKWPRQLEKKNGSFQILKDIKME